MNISNMTIRELHKSLVSGELSSKQLLDNSLEVISNRGNEINAFIEVFDDASVKESVLEGSSLLSGIPLGIKDNILIDGRIASAGSKILENYKATYSSFVVEELQKKDVLIVGRTNMDEFAMGSSTEKSAFGPTRNPVNLKRVPGGTSGGSAAAVAAGMVQYALGSDTGGSVRQPASYCGIVGLKPTYGSVSRRGLIPSASSLDVIGVLAKSIDDASIVFDEISTYDELDNTCVPLAVRDVYQEKNKNNKVIGVPRKFLESDGIEEEVLQNFKESLAKMEEQGYRIVDIDIPDLEHSLAVYYIIQQAEVSSNLARFDGIRYGLSEGAESLVDVYKNSKGKGFGDEVKKRIMLGTHILSSGYHDQYYNKAVALKNRLNQHIYAAFEKIDAIATPTAPMVAFEFDSKKDPLSMYLADIFTVPYSLSGNPAISVPSGNNSEGLPFGMHFVAPRFCEKKLLDISADFERVILDK